MKKIVVAALALAMLSGFAMPAQAKNTGIYVTPKIIYGYVDMKHQKVTAHNQTNAQKSNFNFGGKGDSTFGGALAVGYDFAKQFSVPVRAELEYALFTDAKSTQKKEARLSSTVREAYKVKQKNHIQTLFVNAYYDIDTKTQFTPYLGAGLGLAFISSKSSGHTVSEEATGTPTTYVYEYDKFNAKSKRDTNFAWNVGTGVAWNATENFALDLGYRFVGLGRAHSKTARLHDNNDVSVKSKSRNLYMHQVLLGGRFSF